MKLFFLLAFLTSFAGGALQARGDLNVPDLEAPVVDPSGWLSKNDTQILNRVLFALSRSGKAQMAVLITPSLYGLDIESFSIQVAEKWKLGKKGDDRGVLMVVAPKEKKLRLEVGYGLEGDITDARSRRLLDEQVIPLIREKRRGDAILVAIAQVGSWTGFDVGVAPAPSKLNRRRRSSGLGLGPFALVFLAMSFGGAFFGRRRRYMRRGSSLMYGGGFGGSGMGGFGRGGFGGGGFGGMGGGFGGGGASSGW